MAYTIDPTTPVEVRPVVCYHGSALTHNEAARPAPNPAPLGASM
jgi:hypothetical protein